MRHSRAELIKDYLAGGGIVFDSVEEDEYVETLNKLKANLNCITSAEGESHDDGACMRDLT